MNKKIILPLLAVFLFGVFAFKVEAKTITLDSDKNASEIGSITENTTIDGQGKYKILGALSIKGENLQVEIKNVTFEGVSSKEGAQPTGNLIEIRSRGSNIIFDNVKFQNYSQKGIYAEYFNSLVVNNSYFDASQTKLIDVPDGTHEGDLIKRSASGID